VIRSTAGAQIITPPGSLSFRYLAVHIPRWPASSTSADPARPGT
jgi:hypothetical protein